MKASNAKINLLIGILQAQKQMNVELVDRLKDEIKTLFGILSRTQNQNSLKKKSQVARTKVDFKILEQPTRKAFFKHYFYKRFAHNKIEPFMEWIPISNHG